MNILEQEDIIKGLPDAALMKEASAPSGQVPQFLVISEIKRRSDMRKRFEKEQQSQGTVKDQIVMEAMGIGTMMPTAMTPPAQPMGPAGPPPNGAMPPLMGGMPPQGMPPMAPPQAPKPPMPMGGIASAPQAMPPMGMAEGGIVRMQKGGPTDLLDLIAAGVRPVELLRRGYTQEQIQAAGEQYRSRMSAPIEVVGGMQQIQDSPTRTPQMGYGDQYDEPFVRGITDVIADKASDVAGAVGQGIESLGIAAEKNMPNYSLIGANDLSLPSLSMPERMSQAEMAEMFTPEEVAERLASRQDPESFMDFFRQRLPFLGQGALDDAQVQGKTDATVQSTGQNPPSTGQNIVPATDGTEPSVIATAVDAVADLQLESGPADQRASTPDDGLYGGAISSIDQMIADLSGRETQASPVLDLSDVIERSRKGMLAETAMRLGAGVAAGDISKGIAGAADAASKGRQELSRLEMAERIAQTKAGQEDIRRGEQRDLDVAKLGLQREQLNILATRYKNELEKAASVGRNELFRTASAVIDAAMEGSMITNPEERQAKVYELMNEFLTLYAPTFGVTNLPKLPTDGSGAGTVSFGDLATG
jgi:hypothetical protein